MEEFIKEIVKVEKRPTPDMPYGTYKVVDKEGLYWGHFKVTRNWVGEKFVLEITGAIYDPS